MLRVTVLTILLAITPMCAAAQDLERGEALFHMHCATCHGIEAHGDGPMGPALVVQPPNLRDLATRNGGKFPVTRVVMRIDGRDPLVSHGSPMPVYGQFFQVDEEMMQAETGQPILTSSPIVDLVSYLETLQD